MSGDETLERALADCLAAMADDGIDREAALARWPDHAPALRALLETADGLRALREPSAPRADFRARLASELADAPLPDAVRARADGAATSERLPRVGLVGALDEATARQDEGQTTDEALAALDEADDLRPLLETAAGLRALRDDSAPSDDFRAHLAAELAEAPAPETARRRRGTLVGWLGLGWQRAAVAVSAAAAVVVLLAGGAVQLMMTDGAAPVADGSSGAPPVAATATLVPRQADGGVDLVRDGDDLLPWQRPAPNAAVWHAAAPEVPAGGPREAAAPPTATAAPLALAEPGAGAAAGDVSPAPPGAAGAGDGASGGDAGRAPVEVPPPTAQPTDPPPPAPTDPPAEPTAPPPTVTPLPPLPSPTAPGPTVVPPSATPPGPTVVPPTPTAQPAVPVFASEPSCAPFEVKQGREARCEVDVHDPDDPEGTGLTFAWEPSLGQMDDKDHAVATFRAAVDIGYGMVTAPIVITVTDADGNTLVGQTVIKIVPDVQQDETRPTATPTPTATANRAEGW